jgi:hypothetical protein
VAVILRAPKALSQALADGLEQRDPLFPWVPATPEAFFQSCRDLRPAFFAEVFERFTATLLPAVPARYAAEVQARFPALVVFDGSRLAALAWRLKLLWDEPAVALPGCLLGSTISGAGCGFVGIPAIATAQSGRSLSRSPTIMIARCGFRKICPVFSETSGRCR